MLAVHVRRTYQILYTGFALSDHFSFSYTDILFFFSAALSDTVENVSLQWLLQT